MSIQIETRWGRRGITLLKGRRIGSKKRKMRKGRLSERFILFHQRCKDRFTTDRL
jgi:hypothetical protein